MGPRIALVLVLATAGCSVAHDAENDAESDAAPAVDAPTDRLDAGRDSGRDAALDPGPDVGLDAGRDVGIDAPPPPDAFFDPDAFVAGPPRDALRPIAPLSGVYVTTRTPTLRWHLPDGADGASVEVCADRACTIVLATESVDGESVVVPVPLPPGVVFWRVRARSGGVLGVPSVSWELVIPTVSAPIESTFGVIEDVDGDGFADIVLGGRSSDGNVGWKFFRGARSGLQPFVFLPFATTTDPSLTWTTYGDLNGDGLVDTVRAAARHAIVIMGTEHGPSAGPSVRIELPVGPTFFAPPAAPGDLDGDGYGDLVFVTETVTDDHGVGHVRVHLGGPDGPAPEPALELALPSPIFVAMLEGSDGRVDYYPEYLTVAAVGDVTGDGVPDVLVGTQAGCPVYAGSAAGLSSTPALVLPMHSGSDYGSDSTVVGLGDVTGDGRNDVAIASTYARGYELHFGGAAGLGPATDALVQAFVGLPLGAAWIRPTGDLDGDGVGDVYVADDNDGESLRLHVHRGSATGPLASASYDHVDYPSFLIEAPGDVDGDGLADIVLGDHTGVHLLAGHTTAPILQPRNTVPMR